MIFNNWNEEITESLKSQINKFLPQHKFSDVIKYSVFPTGKLFRPTLVYSLASDLGGIQEEHKWLALAIELHHTYTLIHDDLPAMDNDDFRRGRPSSHKQFSEYEAILAGDGLLSLSYEFISQISPENISNIMQEFTKATGPRGLILGQVKDLANENHSFDDILEIHRLKTGELIQLCLTGASIISQQYNLREPLYKLGTCIGLNFQLLDDLCELTEDLGKHEEEINPFLHFEPKLAIAKIKENTNTIQQLTSEYQLNTLKNYIDLYHNKTKEKISKGLGNINKHIELSLSDLGPL